MGPHKGNSNCVLVCVASMVNNYANLKRDEMCKTFQTIKEQGKRLHAII